MQGGRRGIYGEWIPEGGAQGGLKMGSSYAIQVGGGSQPDTGMNSYNRDTFGALSALPYQAPAPAINNSFSGTDEQRAQILADVERRRMDGGIGVRLAGNIGIPGTETNRQLQPAYTQPSIIPAASPAPSASGVGGFGASRQQELPYWMKKGFR